MIFQYILSVIAIFFDFSNFWLRNLHLRRGQKWITMPTLSKNNIFFLYQKIFWNIIIRLTDMLVVLASLGYNASFGIWSLRSNISNIWKIYVGDRKIMDKPILWCPTLHVWRKNLIFRIFEEFELKNLIMLFGFKKITFRVFYAATYRKR